MRLRRGLPIALFIAAPLAVLAPASASAAPAPVIRAVWPKRTDIGHILILRGQNFRPGKGRDTVVFRTAGKAAFVKVETATSTRISLHLPLRLQSLLTKSGATYYPTRFRLRVIAKRMGTWTPSGLSPTIGLKAADALPPPSAPAPDCDGDGVPDATDTDDDNDLLPDTLEKTLGTNRCMKDTDGDGVEDGYEFQSALDFNNATSVTPWTSGSYPLPYPGKRPYPNPLDPTDSSQDHDNDGLTTIDEFHAWARYGPHTLGDEMRYSDGDQRSGKPEESNIAPGQAYMDRNGNGVLTDDERDADGDGLPNWEELYGVFTAFKGEAYPLDWLDRDTDGDGLADGADDQDHDRHSNLDELQNGTDPFDACLPDPQSPYCDTHSS